MKKNLILLVIFAIGFNACKNPMKQSKSEEPMSNGKIKLVTLDPGHFHASLVQKKMYDQVDPAVHVYAPEGPEVQSYLNRIESYNQREENPTNWKEIVYTGNDYLKRMLSEKAGNVVVLSGNNRKKTEYILESLKAGFNVFSDKPMVINSTDFDHLKEAFKIAEENGLLLYDIMTERFEITTILQKEFSMIPAVFGGLVPGSVDNPSITKESVHHFFKYVSGKALVRPPWFFDVEQQGEGIVDVTTHLVDLVQWEAFPEKIIDYQNDIRIISASRWTTDFTPDMFESVTGLKNYPDYLKKYTSGDTLKVYCNGEINYKINNTFAKVSVIWNYKAPEGAGDTHYSVMRGTLCNLSIEQGEKESYMPTLYIKANTPDVEQLEGALNKALSEIITQKYPGVSIEKVSGDSWKINIPEKYRVGHEAHFGQVTENYLKYLEEGNLPVWEVPNMLAKYYVTTKALEIANQ